MAYHLISIGITNYATPSKNLNYPDEDAGEISAILRYSLGSELKFDKLLRNNEATQIGIRSVLAAPELKAATASDTLILFYSGHGGVGKTADGENEAYLAPYDFSDDITISGISTTELRDTLDGFKHGNKIVLLDCCYSGGANAKSVSRINHKDLGNIKAFQNQSYAEGTFVFTACKEDETAIETHDLEHGLFTYYLVEELVKDREGTIALSSIHDPVDRAVEAAAKTYNHIQTPTIQMKAKGSMSIPRLKRPPALEPEIIKVPTSSGESSATVSAPRIAISDKKEQKLIQETLDLVQNVSRSKLDQIAFRSMLGKITTTAKDAYLALPKHADTYDEIAGMVAELEAKSYQLLVTSAAVAVAGDKKVQKIFAEEVANILLWKHGQGGTVAVLEVSDVIFLVILYVMLVCGIHTDDYSPVAKLLNTSIADWHNRDSHKKAVEEYGIHYASALGGNAKTVLTHVMDLLKGQKWLLELLGIDEAKLTSLILQANLCIVVATSHAGERTYPGYNDYELDSVTAFAHRIRTDDETRDSVALLLGVQPTQVPRIFAEEVKKLNDGSGGHWWRVLRPEAFLDTSAQALTEQK